jgi:hypothetical protein
LHFAWQKLLAQYNDDLQSDVREEYTQGHVIDVQAQITAYHGGYMTFHLCPVANGELDFDVDDCGVLATAGSAAYEKNLLRNLTSASLPPPTQFCTNCEVDETAAGFCGYNPGCYGDGPDGFAVMTITLEAPQVAMDHGVLVWHWFTGNNGEGFVGGEEFMNCADVRILPGTGANPTPAVASPTQATPTPTQPPATPPPTAIPTALPAPAVASNTPPPAASGSSFDRTVWWPGCGCTAVNYPTQFNSKASCEASSCEALAQLDSEVHQRQAKVQRQQPGAAGHPRKTKVQSDHFLGVSGSSMMSQGSERDEHDQPLVESAAPQDEL